MIVKKILRKIIVFDKKKKKISSEFFERCIDVWLKRMPRATYPILHKLRVIWLIHNYRFELQADVYINTSPSACIPVYSRLSVSLSSLESLAQIVTQLIAVRGLA